MSGIVGLFNLDGRPADRLLVGRMLGAIAHRGPDASRVWTSGAVGLGHCLLATTPESVGEVQPHTAASGALSIVFDGRIDNRDELAEEFARARLPLTANTDAAFVLAAYRRWGADVRAELLGDFAFAIWDAPERRLFCARDVTAQKPFYYHHGRDLFLFASEPQALLAASGGQPASQRGHDRRVPVGRHQRRRHAVRGRAAAAARPPRRRDAGRVPPRRYWDIDAAGTIRYRTVEEYCEHLRALLREAVARSPAQRTGTGVLLSGGVDSSSVLAWRPRSGGRRRGRRLRRLLLVDPGGLWTRSRSSIARSRRWG